MLPYQDATLDIEKRLDDLIGRMTLDELINTFYEYSKLEHPEYALERQPADIFVFVRDWLAEKYAEKHTAIPIQWCTRRWNCIPFETAR